ncbi:hypothetical protein OHT57_16720 [Streptomyces sp. NBC_00285]|uniref:hypothetical protein n=1 Tax=Streptomyces sp. NBC_00285 TaxID=2975700 RepID=UPI002E2CEDA4|nr:hypothetical protein [Streptomyces sp. NBC_00285]
MRDHGRLKAAVYVKDPTTYEELILLPGDSPEPEIAVLVTNPDAWDAPLSPDDSEPEPPTDAYPGSVEGVGGSEEDPGPASGTGKKTPVRRSRSASG